MTKSYAQLKASIAKLEKEAAALRAAETTRAVAQIKESIATFGLTVEQLFGRGAKALTAAAGKALGGGKAARKGAGIPKYRDPKSGKTWTGFGKAPSWIATVRNRDELLIDQSGVVAAPSAKEAAAPVPPVAKKAGRRVGAVATPVKASNRVKRAAIPVAEAAVPEAQGTKNATAKKTPPSKKAPPAKKVAAAPKAAKAPKVAAKPAKKAASKAAKSQPAAKTRSPRTTTKAAAPVVTSVASETTETAASAS